MFLSSQDSAESDCYLPKTFSHYFAHFIDYCKSLITVWRVWVSFLNTSTEHTSYNSFTVVCYPRGVICFDQRAEKSLVLIIVQIIVFLLLL